MASNRSVVADRIAKCFSNAVKHKRSSMLGGRGRLIRADVGPSQWLGKKRNGASCPSSSACVQGINSWQKAAGRNNG